MTIEGWLRSRTTISTFSLLMRPWRATLVRARRAVRAHLVDHLARGVAAGEGVGLDPAVVVVLLHAGQRAAVAAETCASTRPRRSEVAEQQVRLVLVDPHVEARGGCASKPRIAVAVHRVERVGLDVAEEALPGVLVGVVGGGEQVVVAYRALEEEAARVRRQSPARCRTRARTSATRGRRPGWPARGRRPGHPRLRRPLRPRPAPPRGAG